MRALLVVNPAATSTSPYALDVIFSALGGAADVELAPTRGRGHAVELAAKASADDVDVVVALGGDGTVNEVVNGLLDSGPRPGLPALAIVPGGSANVFARSLGISRSQVEATGQVLEALRAGSQRLISLGRANDRYFTFAAGMGWDAAVVAAVEQRREAGHPASAAAYVAAGVSQFFRTPARRRPQLRIEGAESCAAVQLALVCNTAPWTYLGSAPLNPCPQADLEAGLEVFGLRRLSPLRTLRHVGQIYGEDPHPHGKDVVSLHDLDQFTLAADAPQPFQVDGDYLGEEANVCFTAVRRALRVVVPVG